MKNLIKFAAVVMGVIAITACSNDEDVAPNQVSNPGIQEEMSELIVKYDGKVYKTKVAYRGDSTIYLNEEYADLYANEISKKENLAVLAYRNENDEKVVEYYPSAQDLEEEIGLVKLGDEMTPNINNKTTRGSSVKEFHVPDGIVTGKAQLWDDKDFGDNSVLVDCSDKFFSTISNLKKAAGFNDKASSIRVWNLMSRSKIYEPTYNSTMPPTEGFNGAMRGEKLRICLFGYHNTGFSGSILYCLSKPTGDPGVHEDANLKDIGWNDRISSLALRTVSVESIDNGTIKPHK